MRENVNGSGNGRLTSMAGLNSRGESARSGPLSAHPDVDLRARVPLPFEDLGGGVGRRPAPRGQLLPGGEVVAEAEVGDLDVHVAVQQQVLRLPRKSNKIKQFLTY